MSAIDFRSKKLNQKIFAGRTVNTTRARSSAFGAIMENKKVARVLDKHKEKVVFFDALKKRGSAGVTKNVLRKVLGDIEKSGEFSHKEIYALGHELIGGSASSRIVREKVIEKKIVQEKPQVDMNKVMQEIRDKKRPDPNNPVTQINSRPESKVFDFSKSNSKLRSAENLFVQGNGEQTMQQHSTLAGYIASNKEKTSDEDNVRSLLAKIQESPDEDGKIDLAA